jgi:hypothetical protein
LPTGAKSAIETRLRRGRHSAGDPEIVMHVEKEHIGTSKRKVPRLGTGQRLRLGVLRTPSG